MEVLFNTVGFNLWFSDDAIIMYRQKKGLALWQLNELDLVFNRQLRADPVLIEVVKKLGCEEASVDPEQCIFGIAEIEGNEFYVGGEITNDGATEEILTPESPDWDPEWESTVVL